MGDRSIILGVSARALFHTALLYSLFVVFAGHNAPGGGFIGGLVAGAAFLLRYASGGATEVAALMRLRPPAFLGFGLLAATLTAIHGWVWGTAFFDAVEISFHPPLVGEIHTTTALLFELGVYSIVLGLVLVIIDSLGTESDGGGGRR